jgi:hypothetical protein
MIQVHSAVHFHQGDQNIKKMPIFRKKVAKPVTESKSGQKSTSKMDLKVQYIKPLLKPEGI